MKLRIRKQHPFPWLIETLEENPSFLDKAMFGGRSSYYEGRMSLFSVSGDEPWNGVLIPTSREHHASLQKSFPFLKPHPVLGKWLYLSQAHPDFEGAALSLVERIAKRDPRFGIEPKPKIRKSK